MIGKINALELYKQARKKTCYTRDTNRLSRTLP